MKPKGLLVGLLGVALLSGQGQIRPPDLCRVSQVSVSMPNGQPFELHGLAYYAGRSSWSRVNFVNRTGKPVRQLGLLLDYFDEQRRRVVTIFPRRKRKKRPGTARSQNKTLVSLDRADAIIEGGPR